MTQQTIRAEYPPTCFSRDGRHYHCSDHGITTTTKAALVDHIYAEHPPFAYAQAPERIVNALKSK